MDIHDVLEAAAAFDTELSEVKERIAPTAWEWYPYGSLANFWHLDALLTGEHRTLLDPESATGPILDLGAADGETSFFLERLGFDVHVVDYPPTNHNGCRALAALKAELGSGVRLFEADLDSQFALPDENYDLALVLGILYHLKNPYYALEQLARRVRGMVLSTRVTRFNVAQAQGPQAPLNRERVDLDGIPVAYLVDPHETNDDPTNFWMFTEAGLRRILSRTGWEVLDYLTVGAVGVSDPASAEGDERAFLYARSTLAGGPA